MWVIIDIFGASIIAGIILVAIFGMNVNLDQATYNKTFTLITQTNAVTLARMIEYDFIKIGYHTSKPAIFAIKPDSISFMANLRNSSTGTAADTNYVRYYVGPVAGLGSTKNPRDRMLYRVEDGKTIAANLGVTSLAFTYYDKDGLTTSIPDSVKSINVVFTCESPYPVDTTYAASFWQKRIYPRNL
jgi:hypothetical protein